MSARAGDGGLPPGDAISAASPSQLASLSGIERLAARRFAGRAPW